MFFEPACFPCIVKQAYNSAQLFTNGNKKLQFKIIKEVCAEILNISESYAAPLFSPVIQSIAEKYSGSNDPYAGIKEKNMTKAKSYLKFLETMIEGSFDRFDAAMRAAIVGNVIDFGANPDFDINYEINRIASNNIDLTALPKFKDDYRKAKLILYIADNYEEALFDKLLIKELLPKEIVLATRSKSILNDITLEDAKRLEIDKLCRVIESGSKIAGTDINESSNEFLEIYKKADIVIAKGQGNYETLIHEERSIYFLFKVKCEVIASHCGFEKGRGVLLHKSENKKSS